MAKASKQEALYVPHAKKQQCQDCSHWRQGTCVLVAGPIAPDATCDWWEAKNKGKKK